MNSPEQLQQEKPKFEIKFSNCKADETIFFASNDGNGQSEYNKKTMFSKIFTSSGSNALDDTFTCERFSLLDLLSTEKLEDERLLNVMHGDEKVFLSFSRTEMFYKDKLCKVLLFNDVSHIFKLSRISKEFIES